MSKRSYSDEPPNPPPKSGYAVFFSQFMTNWKRDNPGQQLNPTEVGPKSAEKWKTLSDEEKAKFDKRCAVEIIKYWRALAEWGDKTGETLAPTKKKKKSKSKKKEEPAQASASESESEGEGPKKSKKATKKKTKA